MEKHTFISFFYLHILPAHQIFCLNQYFHILGNKCSIKNLLTYFAAVCCFSFWEHKVSSKALSLELDQGWIVMWGNPQGFRAKAVSVSFLARMYRHGNCGHMTCSLEWRDRLRTMTLLRYFLYLNDLIKPHRLFEAKSFYSFNEKL